jgi:hypothetical protein
MDVPTSSGSRVINRRTFVVEGYADVGDSGGPVLDQSRRRIVGVEWGVGSIAGIPVFLFSPWTAVSTELALTPYGLYTTATRLLGHMPYWLLDPACPDSPDAIRYDMIWGWPDGLGGYHEWTRADAGFTSYQCGKDFIQGTFSQTAPWQSCLQTYPGGDCPCALWNTGDNYCPFLYP